MGRALKIMRVVVSVVIFVALGIGLTCPAWAVPGVGEWLVKIQIGPAIAAMSMTVFACWLLVTLIFGRIYCSTVCPIGTLQDAASRIGRLRIGRKPRRVYRYSPGRPALRLTFLIIAVAALVSGFGLLLSILDPFEAFRRICNDFFGPIADFVGSALASIGIGSAGVRYAASVSVVSSIAATMLFAVIAIVAALSGRRICSTVCPVGTMLGIVSRYSIYQFDIDTDKCTQCRRCEYACKAHCIDLADHVVDGSRCVVCFDCIDACKDDAIHYTTNRKRLSQPLMQRTVERRRQHGVEAGASMSIKGKR